jgi:hypothetical protein
MHLAQKKQTSDLEKPLSQQTMPNTERSRALARVARATGGMSCRCYGLETSAISSRRFRALAPKHSQSLVPGRGTQTARSGACFPVPRPIDRDCSAHRTELKTADKDEVVPFLVRNLGITNHDCSFFSLFNAGMPQVFRGSGGDSGGRDGFLLL